VLTGVPVFPLASLAMAAFAVATSELMMMGLLPALAESLHVSIPQAGLLVSGYAVGVVVAAPVMAVITNGLARKGTLIAIMAIFILGNVLCALATSYAILLGARIFTAFCHATLFGIAAVIAADVTPEEKRATAVAVVFSGATIATILGVPLGTAMGQRFGWPSAFWMVAAMGLVANGAVIAWLPAGIPAHRAQFRSELSTMGKPEIILALLVSGFTWAGFIAVFTFIAPILDRVSHATENAIVWVLLLFGIGMTIGNFIGGRLADWHLVPSIIGMIAATAVVLAVMAAVLENVVTAVGALVFWGVLVFALAPALQFWVVQSAPEAPNVASTINQASFHLGAAAGAWLAASSLQIGVSYGELPWVGGGLTLVALAIAVFAILLEHGHRRHVFSLHHRSKRSWVQDVGREPARGTDRGKFD